MRDDIRCHIAIDDYGHGLRFYIAHGDRVLDSAGRWQSWAEGESAEPTFQVKGPLARPILGAVAKAVSELGVKLPDEGKTAGLLEAQSAHLADLRRLVPGLAE